MALVIVGGWDDKTSKDDETVSHESEAGMQEFKGGRGTSHSPPAMAIMIYRIICAYRI